MEELLKKATNNISDTTLTQYKKQINKILRDVGFNDSDNLTSFLKLNHEKILEKIESYENPATRRNYLNAFIILYKSIDNVVYVAFSLLRDDNHAKFKESITKTKENTEGYLTTKQYDEVYNSLKQEANKVVKTKTTISKRDMNILTDLAIVSLYRKVNLRADLANTLVITQSEYKRKYRNNTDYNYYILGANASLVLNNYKTAKTFGQIKITIPKETAEDIKKYHKQLKKFMGDKDKLYLIYDKQFSASITANNLGQRFTSIFNDNNISGYTINLNRKRIVSENPKYKEYIQLTKDLKNEAFKSGHDINTALNNYFKD